MLDPKITSDPCQSPLTVSNLAMHFPFLVPETQLNNLDDQWRCFQLSASELTILTENIPKYWNQINEIKDGLNNSKCNLLSYFMTNLCVLPHSSVSVEKIFSMVNCWKTKVTNKLKAETVKDRILAKHNMARNNGSCCTWEPPLALTQDLENGTMYKRYQNRITI